MGDSETVVDQADDATAETPPATEATTDTTEEHTDDPAAAE